MNFGRPFQSKAVEHPYMFGRSRNKKSVNPRCLLDKRSIPIFTIVSRYRSHLQILADLLELKCCSAYRGLKLVMRSCRNGKAQLPCASGIQEGTEPVTQSNWLVACYLRGLMFDGAVFQGNSWSRPTGMVSANRGVLSRHLFNVQLHQFPSWRSAIS